jgi:hypothetical protein
MPDSWSLFDFRQSISCNGETMHHLGAFVRLVPAAAVLSTLAIVAAREAATIADPNGELPAPVTNCLVGISLEVRQLRRDPKTRLAPPELERAPFGKAPVLARLRV